MQREFTVERVEDRVDMKLTAMLVGRHGKLGVEKAITENVSSRGVRVISTSEWFTDDTILVSLPDGRFTSAARVAYCDPLGEGRFATGLEFIGSNAPLQMSALAGAPMLPQG
jgi:PilZ domain